MKTNKQLDKELGIKHISMPSDLLKPVEQKDDYKDPGYPYDSIYTQLPPKKKITKQRKEKPSVQKDMEQPTNKETLWNKFLKIFM